MAKTSSKVGLLSALGCCCICCFLPGIIIMITANAQYGDFEAVPATVMETTYCGTSRRRRKLDQSPPVSHPEYESQVVLGDEIKKNDSGVVHHSLPQVETRSVQFQRFWSHAFEKHEMDSEDEDDDSDDDEEEREDDIPDAPLAERNPSSASPAAYSTYNPDKMIPNRKGLSRRRDLQQYYPSVQRRTKGGGYVAAGAAGGYYAGSHHNRHSSSSNRNTPQYSVTYKFTTNDRQEVTATTEYCTSPVPPVGGSEMILYDPKSPATGVVSEGYYEALHTGGLTMFTFGLLSVVIIAGSLYLVMKSMQGTSTTTNNNNTTYPPNNAFSGNTYDNNNNGYSDNQHDKVENPYGAPPSYGEPVAQATPVNDGPISYTSAAYKPP